MLIFQHMFLLLDLWELYVSFFFFFFSSSVLRANISAFKVQPGPYDHKETPDLHVGTELVAVQDRATTLQGQGWLQSQFWTQGITTQAGTGGQCQAAGEPRGDHRVTCSLGTCQEQQGNLQPSLHCRQFSPEAAPHTCPVHSRWEQVFSCTVSILGCVWNSILFSSTFTEIVTEKKLLPADAADQDGLTCPAGVGTIILFCVLSSSLRAEFLNVIMSKWSRFINLESRPFHELEHLRDGLIFLLVMSERDGQVASEAVTLCWHWNHI